MFKKLLVMFLIASLCVGLVACGSKEPTEGKENTESAASTVSANEAESKAEETAKEKGIDIDALRQVEAADNFAISVTSAEGVKDAYNDGTISLNGNDGIILKVKNGTNAKVQKITVLILCTDENNKGCDLGGLSSFNYNSVVVGNKLVSYSNHVKTMGTETADLNAGEEKDEVINENYENWLAKTSDILGQ